MKNISVVSFAICSLVLAACATTTAPVASTPTAVKVTVSGNADISPGFARDVQDAALQAISHYAPHARPMTVALVLDGATSGLTVAPATTSQPQFRTLGSTLNAAEEGALPVVPVYPPSIAGQRAQSYVQLRGTYAISDADGRIIESKPLQVNSSASYAQGEVEMRRDLILRAGEAVAFRVKALSH